MHHSTNYSLSPIFRKKELACCDTTILQLSRVALEPSLQKSFIDYDDSDNSGAGERERASGKENVIAPEATAPPLENEDEELEAFGKNRTCARDAMIRVEGIPKVYIFVDFGKWGSPEYRETLHKRNEMLQKLNKKLKKVSFCEVKEVFHVSPMLCGEDVCIEPLNDSVERTSARVRNDSTQPSMGRSAKQAFGLFRKPAEGGIIDRKKDSADVYWI
jgi:hypothetical protein